MICPRRYENVGANAELEDKDTWREDHTCSYCGSLHPDNFMYLAANGSELTPTDKNYKVYVHEAKDRYKIKGVGKFYFQHLDDEQMEMFINLLNAKELNLAFPGRFYVTPFFIAYGRQE